MRHLSGRIVIGLLLVLAPACATGERQQKIEAARRATAERNAAVDAANAGGAEREAALAAARAMSAGPADKARALGEAKADQLEAERKAQEAAAAAATAKAADDASRAAERTAELRRKQEEQAALEAKARLQQEQAQAAAKAAEAAAAAKAAQDKAAATAAQDKAAAQAAADKAAAAAATTKEQDVGAEDSNVVAELHTSAGVMVVGFLPDVAPGHVKNFVDLSRKGFYDGTRFHRVIKGFMIQGGDPLTKDPAQKARWGTGDPGYKIKAEFNSTKHVRGVLSMARSASPDSAGSQFFICHGTAPHLDGQYTAFGELLSGYDVLDKIANAPVGADRQSPVDPVVIEKVVVRPRTPQDAKGQG